MIIRDCKKIIAELIYLEEVIASVEEECRRELTDVEIEFLLEKLIHSHNIKSEE